MRVGVDRNGDLYRERERGRIRKRGREEGEREEEGGRRREREQVREERERGRGRGRKRRGGEGGRRTAELGRPPDQFGPFFGVASCGWSHVTALAC